MTALEKKRNSESASTYATAKIKWPRARTSPDELLVLEEGFYNNDSLTNLTKKFPSLKHIVFDACYEMKVKDIEGLAQLPNLTNLEFNYCTELENLDVLANLSNLTHLRLANLFSTEDFSVLANLSNLTHFEICENDNIKNIDFLSTLSNLIHLDLNMLYGLEEVNSLENLSKLTHLNLSYTAIKNIDVLAKLPNLHLVDVTACESLKNIDVLSKMDNFNGKALFEYLTGYRYEGDWASCRQEGFGKYITNLIAYEGDFKDGVREGKGTEIKPDGTKYEGDFVKYSAHGKGIKIYASGDKYEGDFVKGNFHGKGIYTYADGDKYEGDFVKGNFHGKGIFTYANGNKYEGDFIEDNCHGKGIITYASGNKYEGDFIEDDARGKGSFIWANGNKFEGNFIGNADVDTGLFTWADGEKFEGNCLKVNTDLETFTLEHKPTISADKLLEISKSSSVNDKIFKSISVRTDLDEKCREIVDLKMKLEDKSSENWVEETELSSKKWSLDVFESLSKDKDYLVRSAIAKNPFLPENLLIDMMGMENVTLNEKLSILSNPSCSEALLKTFGFPSIYHSELPFRIEDKQNYSSSRLRKAVALHPNTPKEIVNKLLEDEYIWVREAAATNSPLKKGEITKILEKTNKKYPVISRTYKIKSSYGYGLVENLGGGVSIDDVITAILSGEDDWSSYIYSEFYSYDDSWHEHGPTNLIDTVVYPDGSEQEIQVHGKFNYEFFGEVEIGGHALGGDHFFHVASSWEKGDWRYDEFDLAREFKPECLTGIYNDECSAELVSYYEYDNKEHEDDTDIEIYGEFIESRTSGTDIEFYVNTGKNGIQLCDDFYEMRDEMKEQKLDSENGDDILKYLQKKYDIL